MAKRVVSIGAHSLDAELMGGLALIQYAKQGAKCTFVHVTRGERGHRILSQEEYGEQLLKENKKAAEAMGCDSHWMGYIAGKIPDTSTFVSDLKKYIIDEGVDMVITHFSGSLHPRHVETHTAVTLAVQQLRFEGYSVKLYYGENCEDLIGFLPQIYMEYSEEEVGQWIKGLNEYEIFRGGVNDMPYMDYYRTSLKIRQVEANTKLPTRGYMYAASVEKTLG